MILEEALKAYEAEIKEVNDDPILKKYVLESCQKDGIDIRAKYLSHIMIVEIIKGNIQFAKDCVKEGFLLEEQLNNLVLMAPRVNKELKENLTLAKYFRWEMMVVAWASATGSRF